MAQKRSAPDIGASCTTEPGQPAGKPSKAEGEDFEVQRPKEQLPRADAGSANRPGGADNAGAADVVSLPGVAGFANAPQRSGESVLGVQSSGLSGEGSGQGGQAFQRNAGRVVEEAKAEVKSLGQDVKETASSVADDAQRMARSAQEQAGHAFAQAREQIGVQTERAKEKGAEYLHRQKDYAADEISHFSGAMREAANKLDEEGDHRIGGYARQAAEQVDGLANYLRGRDAGGLMEDFESFARRRPEIVYGGMFLAGLGIARFLKASRSRPTSRPAYESEFNDDFDGGSGNASYAAATYPTPRYMSDPTSASACDVQMEEENRNGF